MSNKIKEKLDKMINNPVKKLFKDKGYKQDSSERKAQISFYKLLMILAYSDDSIQEDEIDVIKNHFYENCLTEEEWKEIDLYRLYKPSKEEIESILKNVLQQIESSKDKKEFSKALLEIVNADDVLKKEEQEIISFITKKTDSSSLFGLKNIYRKIVNNIKTNNKKIKDDMPAKEYVKNPIYPILKQYINTEKLDIISAKLGLALIVIHSDMNFDEQEKNIFKEMVKKECSLEDGKLNEVLTKIYNIPDDYFEIVYLCRFITDSLNEPERFFIMKDLFNVARANKVYDAYEDKYLKIIASALFISDKNFIKIKCNEI
jgi:uncharacterized tellurite resistance protein B-like protein